MPRWSSGVAAVFFSALLYVAAFPPFDVAEAAYVFAIPLALWFFHPRSRRAAGVAIFAWGFLSWLVLIVWLRHVTFGGYVVLSAVLAIYFSAWFFAAWWLLPRVRDGSVRIRVGAIIALAALWVVLEFVRTFFLTGFPWLPLAASHWQRPLLLQLAAWTGSYGVSFVLIVFNLGLAFYIDRLFRFYGQGWKRFCPEFFVALAVLLLAAFGGFRWALAGGGEREPLFNVSFVQPYIPQELKWEPEKAWEILDTIERTTLRTRDHPRKPDLVIWPEAVTPIPVLGSRTMQEWTERVAREMGVPLFIGSVGVERDADDDWFNGAFGVDPARGLLPHYYRKRKLVPYGEYVPLEGMFPWLSKIVPIEGSFAHGTSAAPIELEVAGKSYLIGPLICYEDVFPRLARDTVREGAELLVVVTNNGWYGEEGMPFQHAAHSVLRAVETRRPVLRSGNGGWSGWIDEYGVVREVLTDGEGSVFFRGGSVYGIDRDGAWTGRQSFYVRYGDWFVAVCGVFVLLFGVFWGFRARGSGAGGEVAWKDERRCLEPQA
jgi:apolipoprotein N-acyltransferase